MNMINYKPFNLRTRVFILLASISSITIASSCSSPEEDSSSDLLGEWYKKSDFEGVSRSGAVAITIDNKAYVGTGFDGSKWLKDWWEYDADRDFWVRKADLPGSARSSAVA